MSSRKITTFSAYQQHNSRRDEQQDERRVEAEAVVLNGPQNEIPQQQQRRARVDEGRSSILYLRRGSRWVVDACGARDIEAAGGGGAGDCI